MIALAKYIWNNLRAATPYTESEETTNIKPEASLNSSEIPSEVDILTCDDVYTSDTSPDDRLVDGINEIHITEEDEDSLLPEQCDSGEDDDDFNECDFDTDMDISFDSIIITIQCFVDGAQANRSYAVWYKGQYKPIIRAHEIENKYKLTDLSPDTAYHIFIVEYINNLEKKIISSLVTTAFCGPPVNLQLHEKSDGVLELEWKAPDIVGELRQITGFAVNVIDYMNPDCENIIHCGANATRCEVKIDPMCSYRFWVKALGGNNLEGSKAHAEKIQLRHAVKEKCRLVERGEKKYHLLDLEDGATQNKFITVKDFGKPKYGELEEREKVVILVGATGAGKTTWINAFVNFMMNIRRDDPFRFRLIMESNDDKQAQSQTSLVTLYRLHQQKGMDINCSITLIDTPGFADTDGIGRDKEIEREISSLFQEGYVDHIDTVAFVLQASLPRLTPTQKYVFDSMMALFGKDIEENIVLLFTFSDTKAPQALGAVESHGIKYSKYLQFNNSSIVDYDVGSNDPAMELMNEHMWKKWTNNFRVFMDVIAGLEGKTTVQTKDVLLQREKLRMHVSSLRTSIEDGLFKMEQLKTEEELLESIKGDKKRNESHTYQIQRVIYDRTPDPSNRNHTTCMKCNMTCHENCPKPSDADLHGCVAMGQDKKCQVCPNKCPWTEHKHLCYIFKRKIVTETADLQDIQRRYQSAEEQERSVEKTFEDISADLEAVICQMKCNLSEITHALQTLSDIALIHWPKSQVDYIDQLISTEQTEARDGYQSRIEFLQQLRNEANSLTDIDAGNFDPFKKYREAAEAARKSGQDLKHHGVWRTIADKVKSFFVRKWCTIYDYIWLIYHRFAPLIGWQKWEIHIPTLWRLSAWEKVSLRLYNKRGETYIMI